MSVEKEMSMTKSLLTAMVKPFFSFGVIGKSEMYGNRLSVRLLRAVQLYERQVLLGLGFGGSFYLFWNTGIHSDDYSVISEMRGLNLVDFLNISGDNALMMGLPSYFLFWWAYPFVDINSLWIYDVVKWLAHILSVWLVYRFATDYLPRDRALLAAAFFVFNPIHETTQYWYMTVPYILAPALIMYSHRLTRNQAYAKSLTIGVLGSFMGYMSPPYAFGLSVIFLMEKSYKKALIFLTPGIAYIFYYFSIASLQPSAERRVQFDMTFGRWLQNFLVQTVAFFDSFIGPSFFLKIWWSITSVGLLSWCLVLISCALMPVYFRSKRGSISASLFWGLIAVLFLSFGMVSLADIYGHRAFNLGNRLSVYGALLTTFLVMSLPLSRKLLVALAFCFVLPIFGLSDHWKDWNAHQIAVVKNIKENPELSRLMEEDIILVSGNMYSHLGVFSHIDFFNMPWVVTAIFQETVKARAIMPLNTYAFLDGDRIVDPKSLVSISVTKDFYLYDSSENKLTVISRAELPNVLARRPVETRHWAQWAKGTSIEVGITYLSPRLANFLLIK